MALERTLTIRAEALTDDAKRRIDDLRAAQDRLAASAATGSSQALVVAQTEKKSWVESASALAVKTAALHVAIQAVQEHVHASGGLGQAMRNLTARMGEVGVAAGRVSQGFSTATAIAGNFARALPAVGAAIAGVAIASKSLDAIWSANIPLAIEAQKQQAAFAGVMRGFGEDLDHARSVAAEFNRDMVDPTATLSAMKNLTQIKLGFEDQAAVMRRIIDLAELMGESPSESLVEVSKALVIGNTQMLHQRGILVSAQAAWSEYAKEVGKSVGELDEYERKQAVVQDFLRKTAFAQEGVKEGSQTLSLVLAQQEVAWTKIVRRIQEGFLPAAAAVARAKLGILVAVNEVAVGLDEMSRRGPMVGKVSPLTRSVAPGPRAVTGPGTLPDEERAFALRLGAGASAEDRQAAINAVKKFTEDENKLWRDQKAALTLIGKEGFDLQRAQAQQEYQKQLDLAHSNAQLRVNAKRLFEATLTKISRDEAETRARLTAQVEEDQLRRQLRINELFKGGAAGKIEILERHRGRQPNLDLEILAARQKQAEEAADRARQQRAGELEHALRLNDVYRGGIQGRIEALQEALRAERLTGDERRDLELDLADARFDAIEEARRREKDAAEDRRRSERELARERESAERELARQRVDMAKDVARTAGQIGVDLARGGKPEELGAGIVRSGAPLAGALLGRMAGGAIGSSGGPGGTAAGQEIGAAIGTAAGQIIGEVASKAIEDRLRQQEQAVLGAQRVAEQAEQQQLRAAEIQAKAAEQQARAAEKQIELADRQKEAVRASRESLEQRRQRVADEAALESGKITRGEFERRQRAREIGEERARIAETVLGASKTDAARIGQMSGKGAVPVKFSEFVEFGKSATGEPTFIDPRTGKITTREQFLRATQPELFLGQTGPSSGPLTESQVEFNAQIDVLNRIYESLSGRDSARAGNSAQHPMYVEVVKAPPLLVDPASLAFREQRRSSAQLDEHTGSRARSRDASHRRPA